MASLFYLSQGVEVPERDEAAGRVMVTVTDTGERFAWQQVTGDLLRVHAAAGRPPTAYSTIWYRDSWFYVDDADHQSKATMAMLMQLLALRSGEVPPSVPLLTLPVR
jgi:hypothetical protein